MPVWATLALVGIMVVWAGGILASWLSEARRRRQNLERFDEWMRKSRDA